MTKKLFYNFEIQKVASLLKSLLYLRIKQQNGEDGKQQKDKQMKHSFHSQGA